MHESIAVVVWLFQKYEVVHVQETSFLKLNSVYISDCGTKDAMFVDEINDSLFFSFERLEKLSLVCHKRFDQEEAHE